MSTTPPKTVAETGALANDLLYGFNPLNLDMLIRVLEDQEACGKQIQGEFQLIKAGNGLYSEWIKDHEGRIVNAKEIINDITIKENKGKKNLHIFNRNQLKKYIGDENSLASLPEDSIEFDSRQLTDEIRSRNFGKITKSISEANLESIIIENLEVIEAGLSLIKRQFDCPGVGRIDILAEDKDGNLVVIELKKFGVKHDSVIGQILRYIGYLKNHLAKENQKVRGIIIVGKIDDKLRYAVSAVSDVIVKTFDVTIQ
jgi:hypothetical protein